jgi:hypothetical protein
VFVQIPCGSGVVITMEIEYVCNTVHDNQHNLDAICHEYRGYAYFGGKDVQMWRLSRLHTPPAVNNHVTHEIIIGGTVVWKNTALADQVPWHSLLYIFCG